MIKKQNYFFFFILIFNKNFLNIDIKKEFNESIKLIEEIQVHRKIEQEEKNKLIKNQLINNDSRGFLWWWGNKSTYVWTIVGAIIGWKILVNLFPKKKI
jgi:hypothetical protein